MQAQQKKAILQEIARRKAKRYFKAFVETHLPAKPYLWGRHTKEIARQIQKAYAKYKEGVSTCLVINVPPRHGKSDLCSRRLPPWFLINEPDSEVILASYSSNIADDMSRDARECFRIIAGDYDLEESQDRNRIDSWGIKGKKGGLNAVGLGGSITGRGADCLAAGTMIQTPEGVKDIAHLVQTGYSGEVLSFNHETGLAEWKRVLAVRKVKSKNIINLSVEGGNHVRCTKEHRIYTQEGYKQAELCRNHDDKVLVMRNTLRTSRIRGAETDPARSYGHVLYEDLQRTTSCSEESQTLHSLRHANATQDSQVLRAMQAEEWVCVDHPRKDQMRLLPQEVQAIESLDGVLLKILQGCYAEQEDEDASCRQESWAREEMLEGNHLNDIPTRPVQLHDMRIDDCDLCSSYRRRHAQQQTSEPFDHVQKLPYPASRIKEKSISRVVEDCKGDEWVYDLQVEGNHNFFANGILVHNCLIIDDYLKNRAEAESQTVRDKQWDSFRNDLMTRLAPVYIVIILATRWHEDDLVGRIEKEEKSNPDFPRFEKIIFEAHDEDTDTYLFNERFSDDWYRAQKAAVGTYAWCALYQQRPSARTGNLLMAYNAEIVSRSQVPEDLKQCRGWDPASTAKQRLKEDPDYTAGVKAGLGSDGFVYITDCVHGQWAATERDEVIRSTMLRDGPRVKQYFESAVGYKDTYERLSRELAGKVSIVSVAPRGDKVARASILEPVFEAGKVRIVRASWTDDLVAELATFPNGAHDDKVDALVYSLFKILDHEPQEFII